MSFERDARAERSYRATSEQLQRPSTEVKSQLIVGIGAKCAGLTDERAHDAAARNSTARRAT